MSLLDFLYPEDDKTDDALVADHPRYAHTSCEIGGPYGKTAIDRALSRDGPEKQDDSHALAGFSGEMPQSTASVPRDLILVVEDEPLIALDFEYTLETAGFSIKICASCIDAMAWLDHNTPSAALLDIELKDGPSTDVASRLNDLNIPFIVCSGSTKTEAPEIFSNGLWLGKPCPPEMILASIRDVLTRTDTDILEQKA